MSSKVRELAFQGAPTQEIRKAAIAGGMHTLYWDGIDKVLNGITTFEEVLREAKRTQQDVHRNAILEEKESQMQPFRLSSQWPRG